jgi:predicted ATP-dependent Lon-type protease
VSLIATNDIVNVHLLAPVQGQSFFHGQKTISGKVMQIHPHAIEINVAMGAKTLQVVIPWTNVSCVQRE